MNEERKKKEKKVIKESMREFLLFKTNRKSIYCQYENVLANECASDIVFVYFNNSFVFRRYYSFYFIHCDKEGCAHINLCTRTSPVHLIYAFSRYSYNVTVIILPLVKMVYYLYYVKESIRKT